MKVYIAGSSAEAERARVVRWHDRLRALGIVVTSTWLEDVAAAGEGNPRHLAVEVRRGLAMTDLDRMREADLVWFLVPPTTIPTRGAWFEIGSMHESLRSSPRRHPIIASGDTKQSIFCALGLEFEDDVDAFTEIVMRFLTNTVGGPQGVFGSRGMRDATVHRGCIGHPPTPSDTAWRRDVEQGLAEISLELQARGFSDGLCWSHDPDVRSSIHATRYDPTIDVFVVLSPYKTSPYTFGVCEYDPTGVQPPIQHIPNHTVTMAQLIEELDAFLKARGVEPKPPT